MRKGEIERERTVGRLFGANPTRVSPPNGGGLGSRSANRAQGSAQGATGGIRVHSRDLSAAECDTPAASVGRG